MEFGATAVRDVLAMLEPGPVAAEDAARLAALTGSWPELLAHLLLRRDSLGPYPEIAAAIREQSAGFRGGPATRRPAGGDLLRMEQTAAGLEQALGALLAAEAAGREIADRASAAWRDHAGARPASAFDLHLRIAAGQP